MSIIDNLTEEQVQLPLAMWVRFKADVETTVKSMPIRDSSSGPVEFMVRLQDYLNLLHTVLSPYVDAVDAMVADFSGSDDSTDNYGYGISLETKLAKVAMDAFHAGIAYNEDPPAEDAKGWPDWWVHYAEELNSQLALWEPPLETIHDRGKDKGGNREQSWPGGVVFTVNSPPPKFCPECGQPWGNEHGGEYPCSLCNQPTFWDDVVSDELRPWQDSLSFSVNNPNTGGHQVQSTTRKEGAVGFDLKSDATSPNTPTASGSLQPQRIGLKELCLSILRLKLNNNHLKTLEALDNGRTAVVVDVTGSALRIRKDASKNAVGMAITAGVILHDVERFLVTELPGLVKAIQLQDFADDLLIFLRKRGWPEHEIYPAIQQAVIIYAKVQSGEISEVVRLETPVMGASEETQRLVKDYDKREAKQDWDDNLPDDYEVN